MLDVAMPNTFAGDRSSRRLWDRRAPSWDDGCAPGLERVVDAVLAEVAPRVRPGTVVVDLGCGTGSLTLPLAERGAEMIAVDVSPGMLERLQAKAAEHQMTNVTSIVAAIERMDLAPNTVDVVVSNYTLHHLKDRDKEAVVRAAARWLQTGGRMVIGDMMFGRGGTSEDRAIIGSKVATLARRGPAGWWRVAKNVVRFSLRIRERPVSVATWKGYFERAGFTDVTAVNVLGEASVVAGTKA